MLPSMLDASMLPSISWMDDMPTPRWDRSCRTARPMGSSLSRLAASLGLYSATASSTVLQYRAWTRVSSFCSMDRSLSVRSGSSSRAPISSSVAWNSDILPNSSSRDTNLS